MTDASAYPFTISNSVSCSIFMLRFLSFIVIRSRRILVFKTDVVNLVRWSLRETDLLKTWKLEELLYMSVTTRVAGNLFLHQNIP
jgi:hypothetical protein